jgi:hypothetical protein
MCAPSAEGNYPELTASCSTWLNTTKTHTSSQTLALKTTPSFQKTTFAQTRCALMIKAITLIKTKVRISNSLKTYQTALIPETIAFQASGILSTLNLTTFRANLIITVKVTIILFLRSSINPDF